MINHEVVHKSSAETNTQIGSYFDVVDNALKMSDTNKRYSMTQNACYATSCPVQAGSFTTVIISPTADNTADIYNGYIYAEMQVSFTLSGTKLTKVGTSSYSAVWAGFKDSMDAIEKYEILANGITVYSQNNAIEESYITNCASTNAIRKSDIYSKVRHKDIWNFRYGDQCGTWLDWSTADSTTIKDRTIKLKIDLRRILPLSNIKYLPAFAGKIELKLYFSTAGMVLANRDPIYVVRFLNHVKSTAVVPDVTGEFVPVTESINMITGYNPAVAFVEATEEEEAIEASPPTLTGEERYITVNRDYKMTRVESWIPCFGLHQPIYDSLIARYSQSALTFPTQTLQVNSMSNILNATNSKSSLTITPRFIDTIFLLFPLSANFRTCYKNPGFTSFQLNCAGYGQIPPSSFGTVEEPKLVEMCSQALNLNTDTFGLSEDVLMSLVQETDILRIDSFYSTDRTSFFIGMSTETDNTFQQGQTSNTPINYELSIIQPSDSKYLQYVNTPPIMCLLMDSVLSIQVQPNGQPPMVVVGAYDITSPMPVTTT